MADIGSTTTKVLLIEQTESNFLYICYEIVPTTVEYPFEDVNIALKNGAKKIQNKSGIRILDNKGDFIIPLYTTSSAGGGLQIMVFGLTKAETGKLAQMTAYGAGGIISETFTADDKKSNFEKIRRIAENKPDMILMAGGVDGGGIWGSILQSQVLLLSDPEPKFNKGNKIPFIFCGNIECRTYIQQMLEDKYDLYFTKNIRPNINEINLIPAKQKIHELFIKKVIENAPGYKMLKEKVKLDILPTPLAVEKTLSLLNKKLNKNIILIDIGGATTDIFTQIGQTTSRTVSANIGLSYSISNILKETGIEKIKKHIPDEINENIIRNYIGNKTLNPSHLPDKTCEKLIESACAVEGIKTAWISHKKMQFDISNINFIEKRRKEIYSVFGKWEEIFVLNEETEFEKRRYFQMSDVDIIIGAGGIFAGTDSVEEIIYLLNESILSSGVTKFYIDRNFKSPHTGVLSLIDEDKAIKSYMDNSLKEIGYSIVPMGPVKMNKSVIRLVDMSNNEEE
ncbi:MAG: glutamate mutase L [Candidatus Delongbacteria bacterium]|nr:glutamate mutase L [Candidatus Delongbacteria bacterium]